MKTVILAFAALLVTYGAEAQQHNNLEIQPDGRGGYTGTYGGRNFQTEPDYSRPPTARNDGRRANRAPTVIIPPAGVDGKTQRRCYAGGNGEIICP